MEAWLHVWPVCSTGLLVQPSSPPGCTPCATAPPRRPACSQHNLSDAQLAARCCCPATQHFSTPQGLYPGPQAPKPYRCRPLEAWYRGDPKVRAGSWRNAAAAPLVPRLADAHLRIYNASVPLWESHLPGECECGGFSGWQGAAC